MKRHAFGLLAALLIIVAGAPSSEAGAWRNYEAKDYGFSMLIPEGALVRTGEWAGGWGGLHGAHEGVAVYGVTKFGAPESARDIEDFGIRLTGIPAGAWTEIDQGSGNGWTWYRTVQATQGPKLIYGGYGVGPKGSYLLILETTPADFKQYRADYETWFKSIRLY